MPQDNLYQDKTILITGGAGSIGSELARTIVTKSPKVIRIYDNNEAGLFELEQELKSDKLRFLLGDIRDRRRLKRAMEEVDIVFHAAALKHVPLCEYNPFDAVQTNVVGTQNVIEAVLDANVGKMINISTDKAVNPISVMGATKLLAERLVGAANYYKGKRESIFSSVRFGNVLNSRGSIVPLFCQQIKKGGPVTVTNPDMMRFVMTIPKAVDLVLKSVEITKGGEIFILKMPFLRIGDLVDVMVAELAPKYGYSSQKIEIKEIGERFGEKICEELITENETSNAYETEEMFIINLNMKNVSKKDKPSLMGNFLSNNHILNRAEILNLLREISL